MVDRVATGACPLPATSRTSRRIEVLAVAFAALAVFAGYAWSGRYWIDLMDEGYFLYLADRVRQGDLPYRDFDIID